MVPWHTHTYPFSSECSPMCTLTRRHTGPTPCQLWEQQLKVKLAYLGRATALGALPVGFSHAHMFTDFPLLAEPWCVVSFYAYFQLHPFSVWGLLRPWLCPTLLSFLVLHLPHYPFPLYWISTNTFKVIFLNWGTNVTVLHTQPSFFQLAEWSLTGFPSSFVLAPAVSYSS